MEAILSGLREYNPSVSLKAMPVIFSAHGNPMNALRDNAFTAFLGRWAGDWPRPRAILAVSAHWEEPEPRVLAAGKPGLLYDFYGFPPELSGVTYPAPGDPGLAADLLKALRGAGFKAEPETDRGLDHGVWAPLCRIYPKPEVPVVQASLLYGPDLRGHIAFGAALAPFRERGCLIFCSGNLVHNLGTADFHNPDRTPEDWAQEFDAWVKDRVRAGAWEDLASFRTAHPLGRRAHPSVEHFTPLLVAAGAAGKGPEVSFPFEGFEHGTISMRCVRFD
jgi:4,5-DOPA dioxygenase extradiol